MAVFLDTNVVLYAFTDDSERSHAAQWLMQGDFEVSVQVLNEFANVSRRKFRRGWPEIERGLDDVRNAASAVHSMDIATHRMGLSLAKRYDLAIYDAMIAAAALIANCTILHSEDMHHGLVIEDRLTIRNPFV